METRLKYELEKVIQEWADTQCERDDWPQMYFYDSQVEDMASAAELVFDSSDKGQRFLEENK